MERQLDAEKPYFQGFSGVLRRQGVRTHSACAKTAVILE
jgi:hypothetical protein